MADSTSKGDGLDLLELNKQTGKVGQWVSKVVHSKVLSYTYWWQGKDILPKKLQVVFLSADERKYCLGVMKAIKGNFEELDTASNVTWKTGKVVRVCKVHFINDKIN